MMQKIYCGLVVVLLCAVICTTADEQQQQHQQPQQQQQPNQQTNNNHNNNNSNNNSALGLRSVFRIYDECQRSDGGLSMCLKKKAVTFIDRISKIDVINIGDGVRVVGVENAANMPKTPKMLSENDLDQMMVPRSLEERDYLLNSMLTDKLANYISGRKIQISLPQVTSTELGRGLEEGRGKMKKMMSMMMMGFAMKMAAMVPVAIAGLYLLAGKALIVSKIALLLAGIIGIKKLLSSKSGGGGGSGGWSSGGSGGWSSGGGGGHGGGWDRRSNEAQNIAYNAYAYKTE